METTTNKITIGQNDYNNLSDWAKPNYVVSSPTTPTNTQFSEASKTTPTSLAITPSAMQPTSPIKVPKTTPVDTTASGIIASTQPSIATAQEQYNQVKQATGTEAQDAQKALQDLALNVFGQKADVQANQVNLENQAGLQEQQKVLADINTEIAREQLGLRGEQEKVRQGFATEAQKSISLNTLNDTYGRRLADLAIRQGAANSNITMIRENAERQTKLLTAPLDTKISYLSTFGKDNVDFLDTEQKNKLAFLTSNLESQKKDIEALQSAKTQMITEIAQNGGGTNNELIRQIQSAKTTSEVTTLGAGSGYIGKLDRTLKQAQISKLYQDIAEAKAKNQATQDGLKQLSYEDNARLNSTPEAKLINDGSKFYNALNEYKNAINEVGTGEWFGAGSGTLNSAYQTLVGSVKDYYQLGSLDNGVEKLIGLGIPKPSVLGQKTARVSAIDTQIKGLATNLEQAANQLTKTSYANSVEAQGLIGKVQGIKEAQKDPLGVFIGQNQNTTSTDPLLIR